MVEIPILLLVAMAAGDIIAIMAIFCWIVEI